MAHCSNELEEGAIQPEREKLTLNLEMIAETSKRMASSTNELTNLRAEITCRLAELHSLQEEISAMAVKWGIEPIPTNGFLLQFEKPGGILFPMPVEAQD